jgi:hypothetical protein
MEVEQLGIPCGERAPVALDTRSLRSGGEAQAFVLIGEKPFDRGNELTWARDEDARSGFANVRDDTVVVPDERSADPEVLRNLRGSDAGIVRSRIERDVEIRRDRE